MGNSYHDFKETDQSSLNSPKEQILLPDTLSMKCGQWTYENKWVILIKVAVAHSFYIFDYQKTRKMS